MLIESIISEIFTQLIALINAIYIVIIVVNNAWNVKLFKRLISKNRLYNLSVN
jgi:predicted membrane protein